MYGATRATATLIGAGVAGFLLWLATTAGTDSNGEYWWRVGMFAAAGLAMALSQLLGGWTKWGWPQVSGPVFLLGFLPALVAGGWVVLAGQPDSNWLHDHAESWAGDLGLGGLVGDLGDVIAPIAFGLGLLFGFTFDTSGPRVREVAEPVSIDARAADEPVLAERSSADARRRDPDGEPTAVGARSAPADRRVEIRGGD